MSVVVGVDFSNGGAAAAQIAASWAQASGEKLILVHVAGSRLDGEAAEHLITEVLSAVPSADRVVRIGDPAEELIAVARERHARLVVVGAIKEPTLSPLLLGSVAERVVWTSPVPVAIIRGHATSLTNQEIPTLIGVDLGPAGDAAVAWLREQTFISVAPTVGYVWSDVAESVARRAEERLDSITHVDDQPLTERVEKRVRARPGVGTWPIALTERLVSPSLGLARLMRETKAELLIIGIHQGSAADRIRSNALEVLGAVSTPIIVVPELRADATSLPTARTVLVATDLGPTGDRAVRWAYGLLGGSGHLHLLHVTDIVSDSGHDRALRLIDLDERLLERVPAQVPPDVQTHLHVEEGEATKVITTLANALGVDVIVLGAHARSALATLFLGSTSLEVLRSAGRPVFVVPPDR
jgi:nucleotide-binding universal stress UspA family protein